MVVDLTGMEIANASLLDEATAAAEAMAMARRASKSKAGAFFVDRDSHPQTHRRASAPAPSRSASRWSSAIRFADLDAGTRLRRPLPVSRHLRPVHDFTPRSRQLHGEGALAVVAADLLALCLLKPPGEMGADIVVGSTQRFGVPMGYGGPHAAYFAAKDAYKRSMPGRIIGVSVDQRGNRAYRLALQTREQHIRREKATSNICTAQVLLAVMAAHVRGLARAEGPEGDRAARPPARPPISPTG